MTLIPTVLADLDHELAQTRRLLERIPEAHLDYTPHPKSWPLRSLATHVVNLAQWGVITITTTGIDFLAPSPPHPVLNRAVEFTALWDAHVAAFRQVLATASDEALQATWTATAGEAVAFAMPRIAVLRGMVLNHLIHHRAQLTVYYRLLDVPLPPLYGPTADER